MSDDAMRPRRAYDPDDIADLPEEAVGRDDSPFARPMRSASSADEPLPDAPVKPARSALTPSDVDWDDGGEPALPARSADTPSAFYSDGGPAVPARSADSPSAFTDDLPAVPARSADTPSALDDESSPSVEPARSAPSPAGPSSDGAAPGPGFAEPGEPTPPADTLIPAPVLPPRGEGLYDGDDSPRPRRSAESSISPPEVESDPEEAKWVKETPKISTSPAEKDEDDEKEGRPVAGQSSPPPPPPSGQQHWLQAHAVSLFVAGLIVALLAIGAGFAGYYSSPKAEPSPTPSPSPSPSEGPQVPRVSQTDLLAEADAKAVNPNATWAITNTSLKLDNHTARPACFSLEPTTTERLDSFQRLLGSTESNGLALLHQLDTYPTVEAAQEAMNNRATKLAACDEVPTKIVSADTVTGLGDEAIQLTVVYEDQSPQFHSLLLTRTGNLLSVVDAVSSDAPVTTDLIIAGLKRSTTAMCERAGGCSVDPAVVPGTVPATSPAGWLIPSDMPRIRPGAGRWTAQNPTGVTSRGTGCEDMTLATVEGPQERQQRTYLMTQDDQAPAQFGVDQMVFTFADEAAANTFSTALVNNLTTCGDRILGTTITKVELDGGTAGFNINRETEDGKGIQYQLSLLRQGTKVSYLFATVTADYRLSDEQMQWIAQRSQLRLTQG